jgi:hypothetical protein
MSNAFCSHHWQEFVDEDVGGCENYQQLSADVPVDKKLAGQPCLFSEVPARLECVYPLQLSTQGLVVDKLMVAGHGS